MSRVGKLPVVVPQVVRVVCIEDTVSVEGPRGKLAMRLNKGVSLRVEGDQVFVVIAEEVKTEQQGVASVLLRNMVKGVLTGYERKLLLVGVGYKAQAQNSGKELALSVGFSHPVSYKMPEGVEVRTPLPTEIVVSGADKQKVGQVCAEVRSYRPPEPYKGKGIRYAEEKVEIKETKKK